MGFSTDEGLRVSQNVLQVIEMFLVLQNIPVKGHKRQVATIIGEVLENLSQLMILCALI